MISAHAVDARYLPIYSGTSSAKPDHMIGHTGARGLSKSHDVSMFATFAVANKLQRLRQLQHDWDGNGSAQPDAAAVDRATLELGNLYRSTLFSDFLWRAPLVGASESGEVTLEWWSGEKKLTLYVNESKVQFIKVWGPRMDDEMQDGSLTTVPFLVLWQWLNA